MKPGSSSLIFLIFFGFYTCARYTPLQEPSGTEIDGGIPLCPEDAKTCPTLPRFEDGVVVASGIESGWIEAVGVRGGVFILVNRNVPGKEFWYRMHSIMWHPGGDAIEHDLGYEEYGIYALKLTCAEDMIGASWADARNSSNLRTAFSIVRGLDPPVLGKIVEVTRNGVYPANAFLSSGFFVVSFYDTLGMYTALVSIDGEITHGPTLVFKIEENPGSGGASVSADGDGYVIGFAYYVGGYLLRCENHSCSRRDLGDVDFPGQYPIKTIETPYGPFVTYVTSDDFILLDIDRDISNLVPLNVNDWNYEIAWAGDRFVVLSGPWRSDEPFLLASIDRNGRVYEERVLEGAENCFPIAVVTTGEDLVVLWGRRDDDSSEIELLASWAPCE